jgi:hypothetical protein
MNVVWAPPVSIDDLTQLSLMLRNSPSIVATLDDFSTGNWEEFFQEHVVHGTEFYAHLDANFLSQLLRLFSHASLTEHARQAAAMMCLAITFDMKVNPTFATHEYAFTGLDAPDPRLAGFYYINNLHPQQLADFALGRRQGQQLPALNQLLPTKHEGTHRQQLRMHGLAYASLLKIVELHRCIPELSGRNDLSTRARRAEALLDWMYHDFLFCGAPLFVADQLWGQHRQKTVLKGIDACDASNVLTVCRNAAWDLVLAENWAESEGKRRPGDPFHLIFTFDAVLRTLADQLLVKPHQQTQEWSALVLEKYRCSWSHEIAASLADRYLHYESTLDRPTRTWNSENRPNNSEFVIDLERRVCAGLQN